MRVLHTSDWHLGRKLYEKDRDKEFSDFLIWLLKTITEKEIDVLLVAGDIFDTSTPSHRAQKLYYNFLYQVEKTCCRHVVIVAGNHDSPSFINAPKELLRTFNVHVVGVVTENLADEVLILEKEGKPEAIVCAVPYLRDKDIRSVELGETMDEKNIKLVQGLKKHYASICEIAQKKQTAFYQAGHKCIPIIAMGHLFAAGGKTIDGDGVRELYVGSLLHIGADAFPASIDYVALGHLHVPQKVGDAEHIRYCGSPIPMGFGEAGQDKQVLIVDFKGTDPHISQCKIPCFQKLVSIVGNIDEIYDQLEKLKDQSHSVWVEIKYSGKDIIGNLRENINQKIEDSKIEVFKIINSNFIQKAMLYPVNEEVLEELKHQDVFDRCLEQTEVSQEQKKDLKDSYDEIIKSIHEQDVNQ